MKVGDLVRVLRTSYDSNGERWPCEETAIVIEVQQEQKISVLFSDGESRIYNKRHIIHHHEQTKDETK